MKITNHKDFLAATPLERKFFIYSKNMTLTNVAEKHKVTVQAVSRAINDVKEQRRLLQRISKAKYLGLLK